ncbi:anti-sigma factor [Myceligenerans xiligouense]|uniref:Regulator of SigK n=1 Tax=Myceligenerans xiligouense TaxID=253184 RepID=A0A3N4YPK6_9MICO|nr:anti-sigma factor [Myceligenerans xiligouense]RPF22067.1 anti-sigma-K factor RskA [Myceligenerans xiligouense]
MADETSGGPENPRADARDLLPGYALDALDERERRSVERLLESDADARRALDEYRDVVASFVVEAEPPASLRASVLEKVRTTPQAGPAEGPPSAAGPGVTGAAAQPRRQADNGSATGGEGVVVALDDARRRRRRRWGTAVASVAAAVAIAVPTTVAVQLADERDRMRDQVQAVSEMLGDPDSAILRGAVEGGGEASVLVAGDDMFFHAEGLPDPGEGEAYQLWVVAADGSVSSAGVLELSRGETSSFVRASGGVGLAVTVEPEAGSEQPTTEPIVVLAA